MNQKSCPRLSDIKLISVYLTAESLSFDFEHQLFRILLRFIKIKRSVYNCRKRKLFYIKERIRKALSEKLTSTETYFIVDSTPLEICKLSLCCRTSICKEAYQTSPSKGYCASQKLYFMDINYMLFVALQVLLPILNGLRQQYIIFIF